ncbi:uncharacterized protein Dmoj_GI26605 [Drosophila mojavensis]|uniref:Uncharacterized protein n=1 Tax=Drosophila mojavensis TaxID=7230 RepID=A0A0Q9XK74_DROMO|nr:uncharacterized protein Dmoj_GI26605 [Drosophila mojavensis]
MDEPECRPHATALVSHTSRQCMRTPSSSSASCSAVSLSWSVASMEAVDDGRTAAGIASIAVGVDIDAAIVVVAIMACDASVV